MAYVALHRIHVFLGRGTEAARWMEAYEDAGGDEAVAPEWVDAIMTSLSAMTPDHTEGLEEG